MAFLRQAHEKIVHVLRSMNCEMLLRSSCFFGGGTAIVLKHGEYRQSLDLDFLCADPDGYRDVRNDFFRTGIKTLFPSEVRLLRDVRADAYGVRLLVAFKDQPIKVEFIRETRVVLQGARDPDLLVPILSISDMFVEKLLAIPIAAWTAPLRIETLSISAV